MRAWQLHEIEGPSAYRLDEIPEPQPEKGEVRVALKASALNHLDLWVSQGLPQPKHLPHIAGADGAGVVDAVGEGVSGWETGDEVIVNPSIGCGECEACRLDRVVFCKSFSILGEHMSGTLAEKVVLPVRSLQRKAPHLPWETAGAFGLVTGTAYRMLLRAGLRKGEVVLIVGIGGGVSSAALAVARAFGARVFVTSRSPDKVKWALEHGAEAGFDSAGEFSKELKAATGPGAGIVVENVGEATWDQSIRALEPGGRLVTCGGTSGGKVTLSLPVLFFKQLQIIGSTMFTQSDFARVVHLVETGEIDVPIDSVHPFTDLPTALARLDAGDQMGKVVLSHGG